MLHHVIESARQRRRPDAGVAQPSPIPNPAAAEDLVRNALSDGSFHLLLDAVLDHGLPLMREQWALMLAYDDGAMRECVRAEVTRKLTNIERGIAQAAVERSAESGNPTGPPDGS